MRPQRARESEATRLRRIREHVAVNLAEELRVAELAALAGMSVSGFAHWFRRCAGVSPHAYVLGARIALAKRLLEGSDRSLGSIALAVGFSSQACLNVRFRSCEGVTPGEYRALRSRNAKDNGASASGLAPKLSFDDQLNSSRWFMRELNRFGVTSASDAGGGWQNFPDDYAVIRKLAADRELTLRIAYSLFAQKAGGELADYRRWIEMTRPGEGDDMLRVAGAGENLVWSAADFENFLQPRPDLKPVMESELEAVIRALVAARWPFRIHATYDETIGRFLSVFERVDREIPFAGLRWFFDHAETISPRNIERTRALGGGVAIQHRMAYQGEYFIRRYGRAAASACPPLQALLSAGIPVGAGTDGTRVASYHPWTCLYWLVTGKTVGGTEVSAKENLLSRERALRLYTEGSAWFSGESNTKGRLAVGQLADLAVLSDDYFTCPDERIRSIESVLTVCGGNIVHAAEEFAALAPPLLAVSPSWSPVAAHGGYANEPPTPQSNLAIFGADGRLWEMGCGCAV